MCGIIGTLVDGWHQCYATPITQDCRLGAGGWVEDAVLRQYPRHYSRQKGLWTNRMMSFQNVRLRRARRSAPKKACEVFLWLPGLASYDSGNG